MKLKKYIYSLAFIGFAAGVATSCEDMLDKGNDYVIYADNLLINERAEMNTSLLGIMNKVQAVAVRNNLLGELRADLVTVNATAPDNLKDIASLDINNENDNIYNSPADYYAIINNCNYFLAHVDSLASDIDGTKFFEAEIAQVHSIRAWTYLQLVLLYGEVPFVTEPVLTASQADESKWPKARLNDVCDYFINDLKPYYGKLYSDNFNTGVGLSADQVFFPTQLVMGDLYLWRAVKNQDSMDALNAAKSYYDFLVWDRNKQYILTGNSRCAWRDEAISSGSLRTGTSLILNTLSYSSNIRSVTLYSSGWQAQDSDPITVIPMDSASSVGYYNELRRIYNASLNDESAFEEAKVAPSEMLRDLSQSQTYVMYYNNTVTKLDKNMFSEEDIEDGLLGDLRFWRNYSKRGMKWNSKDVEYQSISKHQYQHITVYRTAQVYLRLAEALNYAGYPRMARQILTMGLNDAVISAEVLPYYQTAQDSANISYFAFPTAIFKPYAANYVPRTNKYGQVIGASFLTQGVTDCNMWGIHSRGSGMTCYDTDYAPLATLDSTDYPRTAEALLGERPSKSDSKYDYPEPLVAPNKPSTWDAYPGVTVDQDTYVSFNKGAVAVLRNKYKKYVSDDSVGVYKQYIEVDLPAYEAKVAAVDALYEADLAAYLDGFQSFVKNDLAPWSRQAYQKIVPTEQEQIDQLILDEQALELAFEGNRFYDLMRRALWYGDNSRLANPVGKRDAAVGSKLLTESNWYLKWNGKIGM